MHTHWIEDLLTGPAAVAACESVEDWWREHRALAAAHARPIERAIRGGAAADRVAWAFGAAFQAALRRLLPGLQDDTLAALCITEAQGNAPRDIRTTLRRQGDRLLLDGAKHWATLGPGGALFLVAARDVEASTDARPAIRLVRVAAGTPGLRVEGVPPTAFVPELPHARLRFESVVLSPDAQVEGDGYERYAKPFRTIEDLHVQAALLAYCVREARRLGWAREWIEGAVATLLALDALSALDPLASSTHVALAGTLAQGDTLLAQADRFWASSPDPAAAARWARDRPLSRLAARPRAMRIERAWERLASAVR